MHVQDATKQWQFDILGFAEATPGHTLSLMGFYMLKSQGFVSEFKLDEAKLCMYLRRIEQGYDDSIPYHNWYAPWQIVAERLHMLSICLNSEPAKCAAEQCVVHIAAAHKRWMFSALKTSRCLALHLHAVVPATEAH